MTEDSIEKTIGNLPRYEVPKGPITPEHQAFLVNANLVREDIESELTTTAKNSPSERSRLERRLSSLEHADRYMKGQPYEKGSADNGLTLSLEKAKLRASREKAIKDPDDAAAAANEIPLLEKVLNKFLDETNS